MAPIKEEDSDAAAQRARLADSLSASYPSGALSKAFISLDRNYDPDGDPLSSSCFAELSLEKGRLDEDSDDELTSLTWLQDTDLLRNIKTGDHGLCSSPMENEGDLQKENDANLTNSGIYGIPHPPHVPYNPQKHVNSKPPYSFSCLIFMAVEDSPEKKLPVKDIYNWILTHFPYFQNAPTGWKNSVRHNLSLNKCFKKVEKDRCSNIGKGSLWMIDPDFRPNLLQALRKTPYHPYHQLQMFNNSPSTNNVNYSMLNGGDKPLPLQPRYSVNTPSPHLFPFLSKRLAQSNGYESSESSVVSASDIDVANTLVSLKRAAESRRSEHQKQPSSPRSRSPSPPEFGSEREKELLKQKKLRPLRSDSPIVCYALPSEDHTYSITQEMIHTQGDSPESSIDEEYEFGANDKTLSEDEDALFSESDYDEEGWSEEEELYNKEKQKRLASNGQGLAVPCNNNNTIIPIASPQGLKTRVKQPPSNNNNSKVQLPLPSQPKTSIEEDMRLAEGANALLNLAGIKTAHIVPLRSISPSGGSGGNNSNSGSPTNSVTKAETSDSGVTGIDTSMDSSTKEDIEDMSDEAQVSDQRVMDSSEEVEQVKQEGQTEVKAGASEMEEEGGVTCGKVSPLMVISSIKMERQEEAMET